MYKDVYLQSIPTRSVKCKMYFERDLGMHYIYTTLLGMNIVNIIQSSARAGVPT